MRQRRPPARACASRIGVCLSVCVRACTVEWIFIHPCRWLSLAVDGGCRGLLFFHDPPLFPARLACDAVSSAPVVGSHASAAAAALAAEIACDTNAGRRPTRRFGGFGRTRNDIAFANFRHTTRHTVVPGMRKLYIFIYYRHYDRIRRAIDVVKAGP